MHVSTKKYADTATAGMAKTHNSQLIYAICMAGDVINFVTLANLRGARELWRFSRSGDCDEYQAMS